MEVLKEKIDISVILNCHDENSYVKATFDSLSIASDVARRAGLTVQLLVILDNAPNSLKKIIQSFEYTSFDYKEIVEVSNRSLGLSRNTGIEHSSGEFIYVTDADDLISPNAILASYQEAASFYKENKKHAVFIPEYLLSFGIKKYFTKYYHSRYFSPCDYIAFHPFCSRIFAHQSLFKEKFYKNLNSSSGFAFEDWELNTEFLIDGYSIIPVKDTVLFYRQRKGSIMASNNYIKEPRLLELSRLKNFLEVFSRFSYPDDIAIKKSEDSFSYFFESPKLCNYLAGAAYLDPSVNLSSDRGSYDAVGKNLDIVQNHWGKLFPILIHMTGLVEYDDVILLPWLRSEDDEKFILQIVSSILASSPHRKALIITLESTKTNDSITKLPENCIFLNFELIVRNFNESDKFRLLLRLLLTISKSGKTNLHVKSGNFINKFLNVFGLSLSKSMRIYKYLFCLELKENNESAVRDSQKVQEVRDSLNYTYKFISNNKKNSQFFLELLGNFYNDKFLNIDTSVVISQNLGKKLPVNRSKLLCISKICDPKQVEVLYKISELLASQLPDLIIEVYGSLENSYNISSKKNLIYKGDIETLDEIDLTPYGCFLYSGGFDSLPNIILEAFSKKLPVIAPTEKFSGLGEVVTTQTGWPVIHSNNDEEMATRYVETIKELLKSSKERCHRSENAIKVFKLQNNFNKPFIQIKDEFITNEADQGFSIKKDWKSINKIIFLTYEAVSRIKSTKLIDWKMLYIKSNSEISTTDLRERIVKFEQENIILASKKEIIKTFLSSSPELYNFVKKLYNSPKIKNIFDRLIG